MAKLKRRYGAPLVCFGPHASGAAVPAMALAPDVDAMLTKLAAQCGSLSTREAALLIENLRATKRYRRDVY
jgi:hypothetical protein